MTIDAARFQRLLNDFQLGRLFVNLLGWDNPTLKPQTVTLEGHTFTITQVAHKRGVSVFQCSPDGDGAIPQRATLLKLEKEAAKLAYDLALPTESAGGNVLAMPGREEAWVRRLFERAVGGLYAVVLSPLGWHVRCGATLQWQISSKTDGIDDILPAMRIRVSILSLARVTAIVLAVTVPSSATSKH